MEQSLAGRRVTVMGLGTFGAQIAAVRYLADAGANITVTDLRPADVLQESVDQLADLPDVQWCLGRHDERDFLEAELLVVSPAVPPGNPLVKLALRAGVTITSEIRMFWDRCRAPIVGVTGSNGKSTTATLIHDMLAAEGRRTWLGGNIGRSLLLQVDEITADDWVVLELSSFQLAGLDHDRHSPHVAVVTGISDNHLDWHGTPQAYVDAKQTLLRWQQPDDLVVRRQHTREAGWPTSARCCWCGENDDAGLLVRLDRDDEQLQLLPRGEAIDLGDCPALAGAHLHSAAMLAATVGLSLDVSTTAVLTALQGFRGLPHRQQECGHWCERRLINDSASTTPESTMAALEALPPGLVLIAGGAEKGSSLQPLARAICHRARGVILIGDVRQALSVEIESQRKGERRLPEFVLQVDSLQQAVEQAQRRSQPGETILFSPGFASGSMFRNFEQRGERFTTLATGIPSVAPSSR